MALSRIKNWVAEKLYASDLNAEFNNILNNALSLISPLTGNLNAGGFRITDGGAPTALNDFIRATDLINHTPNFYTTAGTSTAYTLTPSPAITAYATGQTFWVKFNAANGAAPTINISALGAKALFFKDGTAISIGAIDTNDILPIVYDGTGFRLPFNLQVLKLYDGALSSAANQDFTTASWFDGTYKQLHFYFTNFTVNTNGANIVGQYSTDNGSSWVSSAGAYGRQIVGAQGTGGAAAATIDTSTSFSICSDVTTAASENNTIIWKLIVAPNAAAYHTIEAVIAYLRHNGGANVVNLSAGTFQVRSSSALVTALRFSASSGTWAVGNCRVYGFR